MTRFFSHLYIFTTYLLTTPIFYYQDHPGFSKFVELLWEKGFVLCYKNKFNLAYNLESSHVNLNMRSDMPGNLASREMRMQEDQCLSTNSAICKCAEGSLDFLSSEWGPPPPPSC